MPATSEKTVPSVPAGVKSEKKAALDPEPTSTQIVVATGSDAQKIERELDALAQACQQTQLKLEKVKAEQNKPHTTPESSDAGEGCRTGCRVFLDVSGVFFGFPKSPWGFPRPIRRGSL